MSLTVFEKHNYVVDHRATGERLWRERVQRGMSLQALADKIGMSRSYLSMAERGLRTFSPKTIRKLEQALKLGRSSR